MGARKNISNVMGNNNRIYLRERLEDNGGKWLGFKFGGSNEIVVRIRRRAHKFFYLVVDKYIGENQVTVKDALGKERGVAIRFDDNSFSPEPNLSDE